MLIQVPCLLTVLEPERLSWRILSIVGLRSNGLSSGVLYTPTSRPRSEHGVHSMEPPQGTAIRVILNALRVRTDMSEHAVHATTLAALDARHLLYHVTQHSVDVRAEMRVVVRTFIAMSASIHKMEPPAGLAHTVTREPLCERLPFRSRRPSEVVIQSLSGLIHGNMLCSGVSELWKQPRNSVVCLAFGWSRAAHLDSSAGINVSETTEALIAGRLTSVSMLH
jgi:hypothetical protein